MSSLRCHEICILLLHGAVTDCTLLLGMNFCPTLYIAKQMPKAKATYLAMNDDNAL